MHDVIVTGGREYQDKEKVYEILQLFDIGLLIQGGATGADFIALQYAMENHIPYETVEADWTTFGKPAGNIRNTEMLEKYPNAVVISFPGASGTKDCTDKAIDRKMRVLKVL